MLSEEQASRDLIRPDVAGAYTFELPSISYSVDSSDVNLEELTYLCLRFGKGENSSTMYPKLPFKVVGVRSRQDESQVPDALTVCRRIMDTGKCLKVV